MVSQVAYWTVPAGILDLMRRPPRPALSAGDKTLLARNHVLQDIHRGSRCFILATGPSIRTQDLKLLQGEICIAVSNFFVHADYAVITPRYHCIAPYHPPITEDAWHAWMSEVDKGTGQAVLCFALSDHDRNHRHGLFASRQVHFMDFSLPWVAFPANGVDLIRPLPAPQSVTIMALLLALYMGFGHIYLLGCDHDWILHINESRHFYAENQHALNRSAYNEWYGADFESYCQDYIRLWQQYKAIQRVATCSSVRIANATAGGLLDVFPRVDLEALFDGSRTEIGRRYEERGVSHG